jgi:hypothetical protein
MQGLMTVYLFFIKVPGCRRGEPDKEEDINQSTIYLTI